MTQQLRTSGEAIVAPDGTATVVIGPPPPGVQWSLERCAVAITPAPAGPCSCWLYRNAVVDAYRLDGTQTAQADVDTFVSPVAMLPGELLFAVFTTTGGAGSTATVAIEGTSGAVQ